MNEDAVLFHERTFEWVRGFYDAIIKHCRRCPVHANLDRDLQHQYSSAYNILSIEYLKMIETTINTLIEHPDHTAYGEPCLDWSVVEQLDYQFDKSATEIANFYDILNGLNGATIATVRQLHQFQRASFQQFLDNVVIYHVCRRDI